jgi:hypothetical protein
MHNPIVYMLQALKILFMNEFPKSIHTTILEKMGIQIVIMPSCYNKSQCPDVNVNNGNLKIEPKLISLTPNLFFSIEG